MATCLRCNRQWNSWGSDDEFCSSGCETDYDLETRLRARELLVGLESEQIESLKDILKARRAGADVLAEVLEEF